MSRSRLIRSRDLERANFELLEKLIGLRCTMDFGTKPYGLSEFLKRAFDITFVLLAVPLLLPTFLVIAVLIKMDSVGSVFFFTKPRRIKKAVILNT